MEIVNTKLEGVKLIKPDVFEDFRGNQAEVYTEEEYRTKGIDVSFIQHNISYSSKHVLRGLHGDNTTWKILTCVYGKAYLVVVNCDPQSSMFGTWEAFTLSDRNRHQILIPPMFGNGHLTLSPEAVMLYRQSTYYEDQKQFTYAWNDSRFKIWWPVKNPLLSSRDEQGNS